MTVQRINTPGLSAVYVAADYSVTINLPGYSFDMHFNPTSGNKVSSTAVAGPELLRLNQLYRSSWI